MARPETIDRDIDAIIEHEEARERRRTLGDRVVDIITSFAGRILFAVFHVVWFSLWAAINLGWFGVKGFDPYPFPLLCVLVSLENVLLATFVLIRQNRMSHSADKRAHLDLQINLLAEKEISKVLQLMERISERLDIPVDDEARQMAQMIGVRELARDLEEKLPGA